MIFTWFYIFNSEDFEATGLVSKTYTLNLEGIGQKSILVTKGRALGLTYEGIFLSVNLNDNNPFVLDDTAAYIDENNDVWLGIAQSES